MTERGRARLVEGLSEIGLLETPQNGESCLVDRLSRYVSELELWNPKLRLVDASGDDLVTRHILDSMTLVPFLTACPSTVATEPVRVADLGSGAGLPGIPLAACRPAVHVTLVERMGRRCGFLRNAVALTGLRNIAVFEGQAERLAPSSFECLTSRAFQPVTAAFVDLCVATLRDAGVGLFLKGRVETTAAEIASLGEESRAQCDFEQIPISASFVPSGSRHLLRVTVRR